MTEDQKERMRQQADAIAENSYFKLFSRGAMIVGVYFVLPFALWWLNIIHADFQHFEETQAAHTTQIELIVRDAQNDRTHILDLQTDVQNNFARKSDVIAGFELRDQHLHSIDQRLDKLEGRHDR